MEGVPEFALIAIVVGSVLPLVLPFGTEWPSESEPLKIARQALPVTALVLAWAGHFLGHYLDPLLFDPIWGVRGIRIIPEGLKRILALRVA
jgi:hypothetical protein